MPSISCWLHLQDLETHYLGWVMQHLNGNFEVLWITIRKALLKNGWHSKADRAWARLRQGSNNSEQLAHNSKINSAINTNYDSPKDSLVMPIARFVVVVPVALEI